MFSASGFSENYVHARLQALDDLRGMQGRRRHQEHRIESRMRKYVTCSRGTGYLTLSFSFAHSSSLATGLQTATALGTQRSMRQIQGMALSHAPDAGNTDAEANAFILEPP